jgi:hypothetical protein
MQGLNRRIYKIISLTMPFVLIPPITYHLTPSSGRKHQTATLQQQLPTDLNTMPAIGKFKLHIKGVEYISRN